jgi:uncharacterized membrane protein
MKKLFPKKLVVAEIAVFILGLAPGTRVDVWMCQKCRDSY